MTTTKTTKAKDFNAEELLTANKNHEQKIVEITDRLRLIEDRILTNEGFARSFYEAAQSDKRIDETIIKSVENHDKHRIIISGIAILRWLSGAIIGALIAALVAMLVNS